jgi:hypothetical protein
MAGIEGINGGQQGLTALLVGRGGGGEQMVLELVVRLEIR